MSFTEYEIYANGIQKILHDEQTHVVEFHYSNGEIVRCTGVPTAQIKAVATSVKAADKAATARSAIQGVFNAVKVR